MTMCMCTDFVGILILGQCHLTTSLSHPWLKMATSGKTRSGEQNYNQLRYILTYNMSNLNNCLIFRESYNRRPFNGIGPYGFQKLAGHNDLTRTAAESILNFYKSKSSFE